MRMKRESNLVHHKSQKEVYMLSYDVPVPALVN